VTRGKYIARRLIQMVPVLIGVTIIIFLILRLIPGDPAVLMLGDRAPADAVARLRANMGLDKPLWVQYVYYMRDVLRLNLGDSLRYHVPVITLLGPRLLVSLSLVAYTIVLTSLVSLPLGVLAALKKDSSLDHMVRSLLMIAMVMPAFWIGIVFLIIFSVKLRVLPASGFGDTFPAHLQHLLLPALTITLGLSPILIRSLRASLLEALGTDYIRTARAKGLSEQRVVTTHVLRNALMPAVTLLDLSVGYLMGGAVIAEKVFALPGTGALLVEAIAARDYPVVQSTTLVFALLVIVVNLITDIAYSFLDPRVRLG
jgi:peptide/nickel transport system permease protein